MTHYEDMERLRQMEKHQREIGNYKRFLSFRNIFLVCLVFVLGGAYIANEKRIGLKDQIEKAKQDSLKHIGESHASVRSLKTGR